MSRKPNSAVEVLVVGLGPREGGIARYGRRLARALRDAGTTAREVEVVTGARGGSFRDLVAGLRVVRRAPIVIVPYSRYGLWGGGRAGAFELLLLRLMVPRPVTVLHDVIYPGGPRRIEWWRMALVSRLGARPVVLSEHDQESLRRMGVRSATTIPHHVERLELPPRADARARLGVAPDTPVLAVVGWIHPRKGHAVAIDILRRLGDDHVLWFVGSAGDDQAYLQDLLTLARERGVESRLEVTGFVSDEDMADRLAALDVGLCAYSDASASASLSTLLAAGRPVVASDLPMSRDHAAMVPDAIRVVEEATPDAYAAAVEDVLADPPGAAAFEPILAERSPERTARDILRVARARDR